MKKVSNHLGEIIIAVACVALVVSSIAFFGAPISSFYNSIVEKETSLGNDVLSGIEVSNMPNIGVNGAEIIDIPWIEEQGNYRLASGSLAKTDATALYYSTEFFAVKPNTPYTLYFDKKHNSNVEVLCFDETKTNGTKLSTSSSDVYARKFTTTENTEYISINVRVSSTMSPPFNYVLLRTPVAQSKDVQIVNFGDSLVGIDSSFTSISGQLSEITGATTYNVGFGGCQMTDRPQANYAAFSMCNLADAITTGDFSEQEAQASVLGSTHNYYPDHVATLKNINFNEIDIITIAYGTNDFTAPDVISSDENLDKNTVEGALRYSIETIQATYPNIEIVVCTPLYRCWLSNGELDYDCTTYENSHGLKLSDYANAIKGVANEYNLTVCDFYNDIKINSDNWEKYFPDNDGTHPTSYGRRVMAKTLSKYLIPLF